MVQIENSNIEHQVDVFLLEHLIRDKDFVAWFVQLVSERTQKAIPFSEWAVSLNPPRLSVQAGQTDIGLFLHGSTKTAILIENKVMSPFTNRQPERYVEECRALRDAGEFADALCIIVCPADYLTRAKNNCAKFTSWVSYEEISEYLGRSVLLETAIERCKDGWIAEEIESVSNNFMGYTSLVDKGFPLLRVKTKPTNKPTQSRTVYFDERFSKITHPQLPPIILNHQWQEGRAKLLFRGWGIHRQTLETIIHSDLEGTAFEVDPNRTKSLGLMIATPVVNNHKSFDSQIDAMIAGIDSVDQLREWFRANLNAVLRWAQIANEATA